MKVTTQLFNLFNEEFIFKLDNIGRDYFLVIHSRDEGKAYYFKISGESYKEF